MKYKLKIVYVFVSVDKKENFRESMTSVTVPQEYTLEMAEKAAEYFATKGLSLDDDTNDFCYYIPPSQLRVIQILPIEKGE